MARLVAIHLHRWPIRVDRDGRRGAPPIDITGLPVSLLERFAGDVREQLVALLRLLGPLTGGASAMRFLTGATDPQRMRIAASP